MQVNKKQFLNKCNSPNCLREISGSVVCDAEAVPDDKQNPLKNMTDYCYCYLFRAIHSFPLTYYECLIHLLSKSRGVPWRINVIFLNKSIFIVSFAILFFSLLLKTAKSSLFFLFDQIFLLILFFFPFLRFLPLWNNIAPTSLSH